MPEQTFTSAVVLSPASRTRHESKALETLVDEVAKRTGLRWPVSETWPPDGAPAIVVGTIDAVPELIGSRFPGLLDDATPPGPEGFTIRTMSQDGLPVIVIIGADSRGVLFGIGHLLRKLRLSRGNAVLADDLNITTAPRFPIRGHQLGYRPKTNSYDGWDLRQWDQYIRDLAIFGANTIELIPPRSDDDDDSPHFPLPQMEMMIGMSQLADDYGLDVSIWFPAMDEDYSLPETVEFALREWGDVFRLLPRIDAVFVPGGDPGETPPRQLMDLLEKQTKNLDRYHPNAGMWVSPQSFNQEWLDEFVQIVAQEPEWLTGVVYGPQTRVGVGQLRKLIPDRYPIRHYPDITHTLRCQYPVHEWDLAYALTEGREPINPRPLAMTQIFWGAHKYFAGFVTYSEGCNDDVNKAVWSALGWDPNANTWEILRDYARYFIGERFAGPFAAGLLALEENWYGPLLTNASVNTTLQQFKAMEQEAGPAEKLNWRFQQALYRAYYDAFIRARLIHETAQEERALECLREAPRCGSLVAIARAEAILDDPHIPAADWRARVFELAEALFQSIRMQLSVARYAAIAIGRGANLDTIDVPINNRGWLKSRFEEIRKCEDEPGRRDLIHKILHWSDPGPGGYYDDLGTHAWESHVPGSVGLPHGFGLPVTGFSYPGNQRISSSRYKEAFYDGNVELRYHGLEPSAEYRVRVVYGAERTRGKVRLDAGRFTRRPDGRVMLQSATDLVEIHPFMEKPGHGQAVEFDIPREATCEGRLRLIWRGEPGRGGNGRACQVAEVWVMRRALAAD